MPTPVQGLHYDAPLTDISVAYIQDQDRFIARKVFPEVTVDKQSDLYYTWDKDDFLRDEAQERAPGTEAAVTDAQAATDPFFCKEWALARDLPWQRIANADKALNYEKNAVEQVTQKLLIRQDALWASKYFGTGKWGTDIAGVASGPTGSQVLKWSVANSTPIKNIGDAKTAIDSQTGHMPNVMVITPAVFEVLKNHPEILERIKYTERGIITEDLLAIVFDVPQVLVARGISTTSKKGAASATRGYILSDGALLAYAAPNPGIDVPSAGYTFAWKNAEQGAGDGGIGFRRYPIETRKVDRVEGELTFDQKVIGADLGAFFTSII
ncbi:MAG TPA: major capsid protein [Vulgatibacter sp.]